MRREQGAQGVVQCVALAGGEHGQQLDLVGDVFGQCGVDKFQKWPVIRQRNSAAFRGDRLSLLDSGVGDSTAAVSLHRNQASTGNRCSAAHCSLERRWSAGHAPSAERDTFALSDA